MNSADKSVEHSISKILQELVGIHGFPETFVDVGGNQNASVSLPFIEQGWRCVIVEPQLVCVQRLTALFGAEPRVEIIQAGCSDQSGVAKLFHGSDGPGSELASLSTAQDPWMKQARDDNVFEEINLITLNSILQDRPSFAQIGILKIDTESWDYKVLLGLDLSRYRPYIIVTEEYLWDIDSSMAKHQLLEKAGYVCLGWVDFNTIWISAEKYNFSWSLAAIYPWLKRIGRIAPPLTVLNQLTSIEPLVNRSRAYDGILKQLKLGCVLSPCTFSAGEEKEVSVSVANFGDMDLPCLPIGDHAGGLHISYHWTSPSGHSLDWDGYRTSLPRDLPPREAMVIAVRIKAPAAPGDYLLQLDLVHEGVGWLSEFDQYLANVRMTVI